MTGGNTTGDGFHVRRLLLETRPGRLLTGPRANVPKYELRDPTGPMTTLDRPPPIAAGEEAGDDEHVDGGLPEGFFLQQGRVGTAPPATCAARAQLPAVFVRSTRFTPLAGSFVEVTAIAFTFSEHVELTGAHHH